MTHLKKLLAVSAALISVSLLAPRHILAVTIQSLSGDVTLQRRGSETWTKARAQQDLAEGDKIKCGPEAFALISQLPGTKIVLRQNSTIAIENTNPTHIGAALMQGNALVMLKDKKHKQSITLRTNGGTVSTDDSLFELETTDDRSVEVLVMEGSLALKPTIEKQTLDINLAKGQTYLLRPGAEPVTIAVATPNVAAESMMMGSGPKTNLSQSRLAKTATKDTVPDYKTDVNREIALLAVQDSWQEAAAQEVQTNQYEEGRISVDASGHRYRREDYLLRPSDREFTYLTLSKDSGQRTFTKLNVLAANPLPVDLSNVNLYQDETTTPMSNWAVRTERLSSNGSDYYREWKTGGQVIIMNGTIQTYQQVVFSDWYVEYKGGALSPILLTHWKPTTAYLNHNPVDTTGDADVANDGVRDIPRGYENFDANTNGTIGDIRPIDTSNLTVAQRLNTADPTTAAAYAGSEGYRRTAIALVDDVPFRQLGSAAQLSGSTKTSRVSTYTLPNNAVIEVKSDRYYLNGESQPTPFAERENLNLDVQGLTLETNFSSTIGGNNIGSFINPIFFFTTDMVN